MSLNQKHMRGGHRDNAGRKSVWNNSDTQTIRIPKVLASHLIDIAKKLDRGRSLDLVTDSMEVDYAAMLQAMDKFVESLQGKSGGNQHKRKGEVKTSGERWYFFNKFRKQIESMLLDEDWVKNEDKNC